MRYHTQLLIHILATNSLSNSAKAIRGERYDFTVLGIRVPRSVLPGETP